VQRSANEEAIGHLTAGLTQLEQLPETPDRAKQELTIQRLLGQANMAARGYASPGVIQAFSRARELCAAIGGDGSIGPVLFGIWIFGLTAGYHNIARADARMIRPTATTMASP
jgi:hypothetical protein